MKLLDLNKQTSLFLVVGVGAGKRSGAYVLDVDVLNRAFATVKYVSCNFSCF